MRLVERPGCRDQTLCAHDGAASKQPTGFRSYFVCSLALGRGSELKCRRAHPRRKQVLEESRVGRAESCGYHQSDN